PDIIYPYGENYFSEPSGMIVLTVRTADLYKTVTIRNIPPYTTEMMLNDVNPTASEPDKAFLRACLDIENILMSSEEWSSIPDPDKMYE
ncbi:MAG: hypothetical protein IJU57_04585, partial [Clostridia bacterium]|nr:hypothetical protein [Clostridia bacterium]